MELNEHRATYDVIISAIVENLDNGFGLDFTDNAEGAYAELAPYSVDFGEYAGFGVMFVDTYGRKSFFHVETEDLAEGERLFAYACDTYL